MNRNYSAILKPTAPTLHAQDHQRGNLKKKLIIHEGVLIETFIETTSFSLAARKRCQVAGTLPCAVRLTGTEFQRKQTAGPTVGGRRRRFQSPGCRADSKFRPHRFQDGKRKCSGTLCKASSGNSYVRAT